MTRIIAGLLVVLLLAGSGCADKKSVPAGILPRDKMEDVLWDVIQAEQYSVSYLAKDSTRIDLKTENLRLYDAVFRLHQVSRDEFRKSYRYYMDHPDLTQMLFDSLLSRGNRLRTESYSRPAPRPAAVAAPVTPPAAPGTRPTVPGARPAAPGTRSAAPAVSHAGSPVSRVPPLSLSRAKLDSARRRADSARGGGLLSKPGQFLKLKDSIHRIHQFPLRADTTHKRKSS